MSKRILIVEDEAGLRLTLADRLHAEGYDVETACDGEAGHQRATEAEFDLLLLDVMLPRMSGFEVCRRLRQKGSITPVLMLSARGETLDKVSGLQFGADDYVTKPFEFAELLARIEALMRRSAMQAAAAASSSASSVAQVFRFGTVEVHFERTEVLRDGQPVALSAREFHLLRYLIEHRGRTIPRDQLLTEVWGYVAGIPTRTLDVHLVWLRQKLEANPKAPRHFVTVRGLGYKFVE
jgi:two-component system, OmpR family, alkaline phosphatase synthesis response regulator PhoP